MLALRTARAITVVAAALALMPATASATYFGANGRIYLSVAPITSSQCASDKNATVESTAADGTGLRSEPLLPGNRLQFAADGVTAAYDVLTDCAGTVQWHLVRTNTGTTGLLPSTLGNLAQDGQSFVRGKGHGQIGIDAFDGTSLTDVTDSLTLADVGRHCGGYVDSTLLHDLLPPGTGPHGVGDVEVLRDNFLDGSCHAHDMLATVDFTTGEVRDFYDYTGTARTPSRIFDISPDGHTIVATEFDSTSHSRVAVLRDTRTGAVVDTLDPELDSAAFAPDGSSIAYITGSDSASSVLHIVDLATHADHAEPLAHTGTLGIAAWANIPITAAAITSGPSGVTRNTTADVTFDGPEPTVSGHFECSLDGASYASCQSPIHLDHVADGQHAFAVRFHAPGSDPGLPAVSGWTVDTTPPVVAIDRAPPAVSTVQDAEFAFHASEAVTYSCTLDGEPVSPCISPVRLTTLSEGAHDFVLTASDEAGNASAAPVSAHWVVQLAAAPATPPPTPGGGAPASPTPTPTPTPGMPASPVAGIPGGASPTVINAGLSCKPGTISKAIVGTMVLLALTNDACFKPGKFDGRLAQLSSGPIAVNGVAFSMVDARERFYASTELRHGTIGWTGPANMQLSTAPAWATAIHTEVRALSFSDALPAAAGGAGAWLLSRPAAAPVTNLAGLLLSSAPELLPDDAGGAARLTIKVALPALFHRDIDTRAAALTGGLTFKTSNDLGASVGGKLTASDFFLPGAIAVKELTLGFDTSTLSLEGTMKVELGFGRTVDLAVGIGGDHTVVGPIRRLGFAFDGLDIPVGELVVLQRASVDLSSGFDDAGKPAAVLAGGAGVSLGPKLPAGTPLVGGLEVMALDGSVKLTLGSQTIWEFSGTGRIANLPLAAGTFKYNRTTKAASFGGKLDLSILGYGLTVDSAPDGNLLDFVHSTFLVTGRGRLAIPDLVDANADAAFNSDGYAICVNATPTFRWGVYRQWSSESTRLVDDTCDVGPFRRATAARARASRAAADGGRTVAAPDGPGVVEIGGRGGAPAVTVADATGKTLVAMSGAASPARGDGGVIAVPDTAHASTLVVLPSAVHGPLTITASAGGPPISTVQVASRLPDPIIHVTVVRHRLLRYTVRSAAGQEVSFFDRSGDATRRIGTARAASGTLAFRPVPGKVHTVTALVTAAGRTRSTATVARFTVKSSRISPKRR